MNRKIKFNIFIKNLQENDPEIMPDPPVKYLQNDKYTSNPSYTNVQNIPVAQEWLHGNLHTSLLGSAEA